MLNSGHIRLSIFAVMFVLMAFWEILAPRRPLIASKALRWTGNLGVLATGSALVTLLFSLLPIELAQRALEAGWGILNSVSFPVPPQNLWVSTKEAVLQQPDVR